MKDNHENGERAEQATYEDEHTSRRTVTIPLKEYDELKAQQSSIKDPSLPPAKLGGGQVHTSPPLCYVR